VSKDFPDELDSTDPGLEALFGALTASPVPAELASEPAALATFRANFNLPVSLDGHTAASSPTMPLQVLELTSGARRGAPGVARRRPVHVPALRFRVAAVAAVVAAAALGAAYADALPPPVQHIAYRLLDFIGVPNSPSPAPASGVPGSRRPPTATGPGQLRPSSPGARRPGSQSPNPAPKSSPSATAPGPSADRLTLTAGQAQVAGGATADFTGLVTQDGRAAGGVKVTLQERPAGGGAWQPAGTAQTTPGGRVQIEVPDLARNAAFRLTDPAGRASETVTVTVVPGISVKAVYLPRLGRDAVIVSTSYAQPGDLAVLQVRAGGSWVNVRERRLGGRGRAVFAVLHRRVSGRVLQVVLEPTALHAGAVSSQITAP
jgi:hypothetical protein